MTLQLDWPVGRAGVAVVSLSGTETAFLGGVTGGDRFEVASVTKLMTSLAARTTELEACDRLFTGGAQPNRGCADAAALLASDDATAIRRLREAGYR